MNAHYIKIAELLISLDDEITNTLYDTINSEKNRKLTLITLLQLLIKYKNNQQSIDTNELQQKIYRQQKNTPNEFRKLCHELFLKTETFLATYSMQQNQTWKLFFVLQFYKDQQLFKFYDQTKEKYNTPIPVELSTDFIQSNFILNELQYKTNLENTTKTTENHISTYSNALDEYYFLQKLKLICHALNEQHFTNYNQVPAYTDFILLQDMSKYSLLTKIYFDLAKLLQDITNDELYFALKNTLHKLSAIIEEDLKSIVQYLVNFCVLKINKGNTHYIQELFDWYKFHELNIQESTVSPVRFRNIVNIAIRLKEFDFAFKYIDRNANKLHKTQQAPIIDFNKAKLFYAQKKYDEVIALLRNWQYADITFNLSAKVLLAQTFYEKKEFQFLGSFLETFRLFVLRNKEMNTNNKKIHQDFIKIINKLMKMEYANDIMLQKFKQKIEANHQLPDKAWILEKLNEFI